MSSGQSSFSGRNPSVSSIARDITQGDDAKRNRNFRCDRIITDATLTAVKVRWKGENGEKSVSHFKRFLVHFSYIFHRQKFMPRYTVYVISFYNTSSEDAGGSSFSIVNRLDWKIVQWGIWFRTRASVRCIIHCALTGSGTQPTPIPFTQLESVGPSRQALIPAQHRTLRNMTFRGLCLMIYSYNESQWDAPILKFIW
jgi:hypothetical protein